MDPSHTDYKTLTPEERAYYDLIDQCARDGTDKVISNARPQHAVYLIRKLITGAKEQVRIYSGQLAHSMKDPVTGKGVAVFSDPGLVSAVADATSRGIEVCVLTEENVDLREHPVVLAIRESGDPERFQAGWIGQEAVDSLNAHKVNSHMTIMDRRGYRLEFGEIDAEANFGDHHFAGVLADFFDRLTSKATLAHP